MFFSYSRRVFAFVVLVSSVWVSGAEVPKGGQLRFETVRLVNSYNEGCAIADVNNDGRLDVIAGPAWYESPTWRQRAIRHIALGLQEFMANNGDHAIDLNGDGWVDVISASWFSDEVYWYENPGQEGLDAGELWRPHLVASNWAHAEGTLLEDVDGDGVRELLMNSYAKKMPIQGVQIELGKGGKLPRFIPFSLGSRGPGHGMGVGDVNGDGKVDIVASRGWYEAPSSEPLSHEWVFHHEYGLYHVSLPCLVKDLNRDGKNDLIIGRAHHYGLYWLEQGPTVDGQIKWKKHEIDDRVSQVHCLTWADLDGDGQDELITGKRYRGHKGKDPGADDPLCLFRYVWDPSTKRFAKDVISYDQGIGTGMQIRVADLDGDGKLDIAVAGKSGTYVLLNRGPAVVTSTQK